MALEGFKVARPITGRAATATSARGTLTTAGVSVKALAGRAATTSSARGTLTCSRRFAARAGTTSSARGTLAVYAFVPLGPLALFRTRVATVLDAIDPTSVADVFAGVRDTVTLALESGPWEVHAGVVDSLTPPAYVLEWADPWTEPSTHCFETARLEILVVAPRVEPAEGVAELERMVEAALAALTVAGVAHGETSAPREFEIAGVPCLACRIQVETKVPIGG